MLVTLSMPDDLYAKFVEQSPTTPNKVILELIKRFQDVKSTERAVVLTKEQRAQIEALFGEGIDGASWDKFIRWLKDRTSVNLGEHQVQLSNTQWKRVMESARFFTSKNGKVEGDPASAWLKKEIEYYLLQTLGV